MQIILFQAELPEQLPFLDDLLDLLIATLVDIPDLDRALFDKIDLIVIVGFEVNVFTLGYFDNMVLYFQVFVLFL